MDLNQLPHHLKIGALTLIVISGAVFLVMGESQTPEKAGSISGPASGGESQLEGAGANQPVAGTADGNEDSSLPELPLAHTVRDIEVRGSIHIDQQGNLIYNRELRQFLEFFLGQTRSQEDEDAMRAHMIAAMEQRGIPTPVQQQVMTTLDAYLSYRQAKEELAQQRDEQELDTIEIFREVQRLRRSHLGLELAEAFFGQDEARTETMLAEHRLINNDALDDTTREQLLRELESDLPDSVREVRQRSRQITGLNQRVQQMREEGASEQAIQAVRRETMGAEAAEQLAEVDRQRNQWQQRMEQYREKKAALETNEGLSEQDRAEAISQLQEEHFDSEHERRRAQALERIAESGETQNSS